MLFTSPAFLFLFLPVFLLSYFILGRRNIIILAFSLFFYFYGEGWIVALLGVSVVIAWLHGRILMKLGPQKWAFWAALILQLGMLGYFKYSDFFVSDVFRIDGAGWTWPEALLPIGISFSSSKACLILLIFTGAITSRPSR